jgi:hypothetical protein
MCQKTGQEMAILHARATYYPEFNIVISHNPKAIRAIVRRLNKILDLGLRIDDMDRQAREFEARIGYMGVQNREFQLYVEALEKEYLEPYFNDSSDLSADDAIRAAEDFLRFNTDKDV